MQVGVTRRSSGTLKIEPIEPEGKGAGGGQELSLAFLANYVYLLVI